MTTYKQTSKFSMNPYITHLLASHGLEWGQAALVMHDSSLAIIGLVRDDNRYDVIAIVENGKPGDLMKPEAYEQIWVQTVDEMHEVARIACEGLYADWADGENLIWEFGNYAKNPGRVSVATQRV